MSEKQIPVSLDEVVGLPVTQIEYARYDDYEVTIVLGDVTITIKHDCCGCCDAGYTIDAKRLA